MIHIATRKTINAFALSLALTATGVAAADTLPSAARAQSASPAANARHNPRMRDADDMPSLPPGMAPHVGGPSLRGEAAIAFAAIHTIEEIAHWYRVGGHPENVLPFYRETLSQTRDPMLRHHLRDAIAREELKPADTTAAIATLRAQLNEDLAALPSPSPRLDAKRR
ncbi:hypothetical protein [Pandoraea terrigena]|uniref:Lipoprotein n=1 Tax=Pandoraea terrigena TaxID=2508292 RepID=A0A5E4YXL4_9BURK|nr:hypothetical protein [Pandoraea terrigena]VVE53198.1 hypothetical protein PTE31013_04871 [Pandoraea terrigena]